MDETSLKDRLQKFIADHGLKHWAHAARKDADFVSWVNVRTADFEDLSFPERVYVACTGVQPVCELGGRRVWNSIEKGFRFCGRAKECACARQSVSESCKTSIAKRSDHEQEAINLRRAKTNVDKHGVANIGQTQQARASHQAFYADTGKVAKATEKGRATMMAEYGVDNALKLPKVNEIRKTIAANLSEEARANRSRLRMARSLEISCAPTQDFERSSVTLGHDSFDHFVDSLGVSVIHQSVLGNHVVDFLIPSCRIGIDYCDLRAHCQYEAERGGQKVRGPQCHLDKHQLCEAAGIRLITIFSDEWLQKREMVKDRIQHILGLSGSRIAARTTRCAPIDNKQAVAFLDTHHIQGAGVPAGVRYGLFSNEELVAVMTFGKPRRSNNQKAQDGTWELYRFATEGAVIGGASKLFAAFVRDHQPSIVKTFADRRWGEGAGYLRLGFQLEGDTAPAYWYVEKYTNRINRYHYTKYSLVKAGFDPAKTEAAIMKERGFDIIWDCGNRKYIWTKPV